MKRLLAAFFSVSAPTALLATPSSKVQRKLLSLGKVPGLYEVSSAKPTYKFIIPLPEDDLYSVYQDIAGDAVQPIVRSLVTVAISANQTVIWYDHGEDGFDDKFEQNTTLIWGDANATNGCRPDVPDCTDEDDILYLGDVFYLTSDIDVPRNNETYFFDNGDMIYADYPLTITRSVDANIPDTQQSLSAATEVVDDAMMFWGKEFTAPVGPEFATATNSFDLVKLFLLSGDDDNEVTLPNGNTTTLGAGKSLVLDMHLGDHVAASKNSLAHLITADTTSKYEMRWLSLLPDKAWSNEYIAPVGDETGNTNVLLYNPGTKSITVDFTTIGPDGEPKIQPIPVPPKSAALSPCVGTCCEIPCPGEGGPKSAARLKSPNGADKFAAFTVSNVKAGTPPFFSNVTLTDEESGQAFDWGVPLIPTSELTHQAQVSLGDGCRNNVCSGQSAPSALWISPDADADVFIDRRHMGGGYDMLEVGELESATIHMDDLSGAIIFATEKGSGIGGFPVNFAGAWGRDASVPSNDHAIGGTSLKGGTTLLPYDVFGQSAKKGPGKTVPGATIEYEILIENLGHMEYGPGDFVIHDELPFGLTYVEGSMEYSSTAGSTWVALENDIKGGTTYQLDEGGLPGPDRLLAHGGVHMVRYSTTVDDPVEVVDYNNEVDVSFPNHEDPLELSAKTKLNFEESIETSVGVYMGTECNNGCAEAEKSVMVLPGNNVTFCITVRNTGKQPLADVNVTIPLLAVELGDIIIPTLDLEESKQFTYEVNVPEKAVIVPTTRSEGNPVFFNGKDIWTRKNVVSTDFAKAEAYDPSIAVQSKVSLSGKCADGKSSVGAYDGEDVLICFEITNTGNSFLSEISFDAPELDYAENDALLAPSKSKTIQFPWTLARDLTINATVSGLPSDGKSIFEELETEYSTSLSAVKRLTRAPTVSPSTNPSAAPSTSQNPSVNPSMAPSEPPFVTPTGDPTTNPSFTSSENPTTAALMSLNPSSSSSLTPSVETSIPPSSTPTATPSLTPESTPSLAPASAPSTTPSSTPSSTHSTKPTSVPSRSPSSTPSSVPVSPIQQDSSPVADLSVDTTTRSANIGSRGGGGGDPHFKTWHGQKYDYHGECDLVLVDNPSFANGLGLSIHIRTTRKGFMSFIERAALRIGADVLEFENSIEWLFNGKAVQSDGKLSGYEVWRFPKALSVRLDNTIKAKVDFIMRNNGMPFVRLDGGNSDIFRGSLGMIGDWESGNMTARDGETTILDPSRFAAEWQVRPGKDGSLFKTPRAPQYPHACLEPTKSLGPRLGSTLMLDEAQKACRAWGDDKDECIFDVMTTRDISAAEGLPVVG